MIENSETFVSCGYDCNINVFDTRKRLMVQQWPQPHPMATVAVTSCGLYAVAGNLKGDIVSFDFRNMKEPLDTKLQAHNEPVVRVAFVPNAVESSSSTILGESRNVSECPTTPEQPTNESKSEGLESFAKFVDLCHYNNNRSVNRRDTIEERHNSWDDLVPSKKLDMSTDSMFSPTRLSLGFNSSRASLSELRFKRKSRSSLNATTFSDIEPINRRDSAPLRISVIKEAESTCDETATKRRNMSLLEASEKVKKVYELDDEIDTNQENRNPNQPNIDTFTKFLKNSHVSTPNAPPPQQFKTNSASKMIISNVNKLRGKINDLVKEKMSTAFQSFSLELDRAENGVFDACEDKIYDSGNDIKYYQDYYSNSGFRGGYNLNERLEEKMTTVERGMLLLMHEDEPTLEYYRIKTENIRLKQMLKEQSQSSRQ